MGLGFLAIALNGVIMHISIYETCEYVCGQQFEAYF